MGIKQNGKTRREKNKGKAGSAAHRARKADKSLRDKAFHDWKHNDNCNPDKRPMMMPKGWPCVHKRKNCKAARRGK